MVLASVTQARWPQSSGPGGLGGESGEKGQWQLLCSSWMCSMGSAPGQFEARALRKLPRV
jgi:hypothetical protein